MACSLNIFSVILCAILQLVFIQPTYQYLYSCNSSAACGCSSNSASVMRIVGGEAAGDTTWGWTVSILINDNELCGGSILSSSWIITAAHCMYRANASTVTVYAGSNTRFTGQARAASNIIIHPRYNTTTMENDIALIQLATPINMTDPSVSAICLPSVSADILDAGEWPPAGLYVVAVGWGTLWSGGILPFELQQVTVQTVAFDAPTCYTVVPNPYLQFCAGVSGGGKDTCQGDSGGPLMMFTESNQWELVGVTSYGVGCGLSNSSGVYARVAYYQNWISTTTGGAYTHPTSSVSANINPNPFTITPAPSTTTILINSSTIISTGIARYFINAYLLIFLSSFLIDKTYFCDY